MLYQTSLPLPVLPLIWVTYIMVKASMLVYASMVLNMIINTVCNALITMYMKKDLFKMVARCFR